MGDQKTIYRHEGQIQGGTCLILNLQRLMIPCERAIKMCDVIPERLQLVPFELKLNHTF